MQARIKAFLLCSTMATLAACGGGGDDSTPSYSGSTRTVAVTDRGSADAVVSDTLCVLFTCGTGGASRSVMARSAAVAFDAAGLFRTSTSRCAQGGTRTVTQTEDGYFAVGHRATVEYDQCTEYDHSGGFRLDGTHESEIIAVTGDPLESADWSITVSGHYDAHRLDELDSSGRSVGYILSHGSMVPTQRAGSGEFDLVLETRYPQLYTKSDFGTPMETLVRNGRRTLKSSSTVDRIVTAQEGGLCSTLFDGCITLLTPTDFNFPGGFASAPDAGEMVITAADGAKVRVTIVDATQVTIEYDVNPVDGTYEDPQSTTWDALQK